MTDIVERLRDADPHEHGDNYQLCGDAADEMGLVCAERDKWLGWLVHLRKCGRLSGMNALLDEMNAADAGREHD